MHIASREHARRLAKQTPVTYMIFDLLWLDGHSLMELPYAERRERLAGLALDGEAWQTPEHVVGHGKQLLEASQEQHLEGIVAKRLSSRYEPGRRGGAWLKIKTFGRQEFVIGGWLPGKGRRSATIGALLLGVYEAKGALRYVGRVGTGFSEKELERLQGCSSRSGASNSPFGAANGRRARPSSSSPASSPRSTSRSGRAPGASATPPTRGCARTSRRSSWSARTRPAPPPLRGRRQKAPPNSATRRPRH